MGFLQRLDESLDINVPLAVVASFLCWLSLYCILCLANSKRSYEWHCRVVTGVHALVISVMSYTFGMYYNPWFITNPGGRNNNLEILTLVICLGYFLFDICWCVWFREDGFMIVHHFLTIVCITISLLLDVSGTEVGAAIFGAEASNPMLQLRYLMREAGYTKNLAYELNDLLFMGTFTFCRMGIGTYALYNYIQHPAPLLIFKIGSCGLYLVSLIFMYSIARFAWRKYSRMYRSLRAGCGPWGLENGKTNGDVATATATATPGNNENGHISAGNHEHKD
ncbi:TLC domain-containing protein 5-like [Diadema setosum]|uniref:TLC domain-containing protein 5-like n=1 Tax=Diadema setosum TaxID=31175 RepID=UPI003B3A0AA6